MNSITSLIPRARPVKIAATGQTLQIGEFTLNDLADLQSALDALWVDPLTEIEGELPTIEGEARRKLLVAAHERAETGPAVYGEPSGNEYYSTPEGAAAFLWVACSKHQPRFSAADAVELMTKVSPGEYSQIWRITHGTETMSTIERMLGMGAAKRASRTVTWGETIEQVCKSHPGWTYADVYGLTISEFVNARRLGKPSLGGVPVPMNAEAIAKAIADQKSKFFGPEPAQGES